MRLILGIILLSYTNSIAEPVREGALITELVSSKQSIAPGETIDIALRIKHDKGWHTYWKSPGIVGVPTGLAWKLPDGFKAGKILWPQPETVKMGPYNAYGYHGEVFLIIPLTASQNAKPGTNSLVQARASWMCCSTVCQPAFADLNLSIQISKSAQPHKNTKWSNLINNSRSTFAQNNQSWKTTAVRKGKKIILTLSPLEKEKPSAPRTPYFFCEDGLIHSDKKQSIKILPSRSIVFRLHVSEFGPENPTHLKGIFYNKNGLPDNSGATPIYINAPIKDS
ncbi:MAG: protein-disulfide reductase DsbD domain-containing protein [Verrucomicrobiota bacterium]|nr:protein-disulfide reductase DsbD domain-containing protein [Verrucomicrobiota bacterium]